VFSRSLTALAAALVWLQSSAVPPSIPKTWDADAFAGFELPLVNAERSARHIDPAFYYRLGVRPIYRSYPIYAPGREPQGYMEWLARQEPEIAFDASRLKTDADWIAAGEIVFEAPIGYGATFKLSQVRDAAWYSHNQVPVTAGVMPFARYVVRSRGAVEVGSGGCIMCHARVMPDGQLLKGAQGNFPADRVLAYNLRAQAAATKDPAALLDGMRLGQRLFFSMDWLKPDPVARINTMSIEDIAAVYDAIPVGTTTRVNLSLFAPAQIPDLIGIADRKHLDHTGIVRQRSIADLMRYVALVQGANGFDRFGTFALIDPLPDPTKMERYSDGQLFALARYLYSLSPPKNPNQRSAVTERGQRIFSRAGCPTCHTPPLYTNNDVVAASEIGTDPELALRTRKGTGYYKVPSLKGVWYRGPFQHAGAARSLEAWFDRDRRRTIPGHPFGLDLNAEDRRALIAFLNTL
jgi:hypothetical protein